MRERGGPYYRHYVKGRDGRAVRRYVGGGRVAAVVVQFDEFERIERELEALQEQEERERFLGLVALLDELGQAAEILTQAHLIAAGFHEHRGQWRRRREST